MNNIHKYSEKYSFGTFKKPLIFKAFPIKYGKMLEKPLYMSEYENLQTRSFFVYELFLAWKYTDTAIVSKSRRTHPTALQGHSTR